MSEFPYVIAFPKKEEYNAILNYIEKELKGKRKRIDGVDYLILPNSKGKIKVVESLDRLELSSNFNKEIKITLSRTK